MAKRRDGSEPMPTDPTLETLIAGGQFAVAADRYEEQTGDSELAALMRIEGLEWELVDGKPELRMKSEWMDIDDGRFCWWHLHCGTFDFKTVTYEPMDGVPMLPLPSETPISLILEAAGLDEQLADRFYQLYRDAVAQLRYGK